MYFKEVTYYNGKLMITPLHIVILAAGQGKRMRSRLPKVLHPLGKKPILHHVILAAEQLKPAATYVVYGHGGDEVQAKSQGFSLKWVEQAQQLGTGHAVTQALSHINDDSQVLVLVGDTPLINPETLKKLISTTPASGVGVVTVQMPDPTGLGRIIRDSKGKVTGIVEEKDATDQQRQITEINTGIILAPAKQLKRWLSQVKNNNKQGEFYLTDIIQLAAGEGVEINPLIATSHYEVQGINDRSQLALLERYYQLQQAEKLMQEGVTLLDPNRFDLRGELQAASDVVIDIDVVIEGKVIIGEGTYIGPHCVLCDVTLGKNVVIKSHSVLEESEVADDCIIGPFARLRPGAQLARGAHIGNFVEVKKSKIGEGSKVNHLSYVGDAIVGSKVNIGAGTITCNYDGINKHQTIIEDNVFIGSDTQLVAPVTIGSGAVIGAGSTVTKDAPKDAITVTQRLDQRVIEKK